MKIIVKLIQKIQTLLVRFVCLLKNPNLYLFILFLFIIYLFFIKSKNSLSILLITNQGIIFQLIPFIFFFIFILLCLKKFGLNVEQSNTTKVDIGTVATIFSIVIALLFFMFQNTQDTMNKIQSLQIITTANCEYSKSITPRNFFSYDIYNENIAFILNQFGPEAIGITYKAIAGMEKANMISDNNQNLSQTLSDVKKVVCDELGPIMYSKTEIAKYSFGSAVLKLAKDFFLL